MYRKIRRIVPAVLTAGTLLLAACGDDSARQSTTTAAPETTIAVETTDAPDTTTGPTEPEVTITAPDTTEATMVTVPFQDPQEQLNPITGYTFLPLPDGVAEALVEQVSADQTLSSELTAVGAIMLQDDATTDQVLVIFFGLNQEFTGADADAYYEAATAGGTSIIDVDVDGRPGKAFLIDGRSSFTTLTGSTAILAQADTTDALEAAV
ncbi:MAG: hypothetical protein LH616_02945, partial [Ilumatobacteraceae bacterium]|nr:hypothetical protein [Ilumatobacteraceae bacterium]